MFRNPLLRKIQALQMEKTKKALQMEKEEKQEATSQWNLNYEQGSKLQEMVNTLQNEKKFKELEEALEKANARERRRFIDCFIIFFWFISLCFAFFVGRALEAGQK